MTTMPLLPYHGAVSRALGGKWRWTHG
uniref:Uncharacterized protein n=1 Tax=Arundo donax TaxID=35708 RepID=A0A0A9GFJ2_ARUDO